LEDGKRRLSIGFVARGRLFEVETGEEHGRGGNMKSEEEIMAFYEENKKWLERVVSNEDYPRILRALAGAVIEVALKKRGRGKK
jgi:hypothetical protein